MTYLRAIKHTRTVFFAFLAGTMVTATATTPAVAASPSSPAVKEWTMLVFLNGNNNLDEYGYKDMNEMETVGSTNDINVVVQFASYKAATTKRYYITKDQNPNQINSQVVEDLPRVDMGDVRNLVEFIRWGVARYPARHYFVDVWDHGSGWHAFKNRLTKGTMGTRAVLDISWDDYTGHSITTKQLGEAVAQMAQIMGHRVDIYGSDACLMGSIEIATEMKNTVDVYVGSEEVEPGDGWPYDTFLARWAAAGTSTPEDVAKYLVETYIASYQASGSGTLSAYRLANTDTLNNRIADLARVISTLDSGMRRAVATAVTKTQSFAFPDYKDLRHFTELLGQAAVLQGKQQVGDALIKSIQDFVIVNGRTKHFPHAEGVSIWIPDTRDELVKYRNSYKQLSFAIANWTSALDWIFP